MCPVWYGHSSHRSGFWSTLIRYPESFRQSYERSTGALADQSSYQKEFAECQPGELAQSHQFFPLRTATELLLGDYCSPLVANFHFLHLFDNL